MLPKSMLGASCSSATWRLAYVLVACALGSCSLDPVHEEQVRALGPEPGDFPPGPYHRPGQACTVCHGGRGPADSVFLVAGTVFADASGRTPNGAVEVRVRDATQTTKYTCVRTNCNGNFFITGAQYPQGITFPLKASMRRGTEKVMDSLIGREGACSACHQRSGDRDSALPLFIERAEPADPCTPNTPASTEACP